MIIIWRRRLWFQSIATVIGVCFIISMWRLYTYTNKSIPKKSTQFINYYIPLTKEQSNEIPFDVKQLPPGDYTKLINLHEFVFDLINVSICNDPENPPLLLIFIPSKPSNLEKRNAIRGTWGQPQELIRVIFILGRVNNQTIQEQVYDENFQYHDLVQGNFLDTYHNMTYKHVIGLKYSVYHCPRVKYVLKTDDDVFINIPLLVNLLSVNISQYGARRLVYCRLNAHGFVQRSHRVKHSVSTRDFFNHYYPPYCPGYGVIYSQDVVFKLYVEAQRTKYFWIEDVHVTGILVQRANLTHTRHNLTLSVDQTDALISLFENDTDFKQSFNNKSLNFIFARPNLKKHYIETLWYIVQRFYSSL